MLIEELELGEIRGGLPMVRPAPCDAVEWAAASAGRAGSSGRAGNR